VGYFQEIVTEYLRADRTTFVNTECLIQLNPGDVVSKGTHWYCDAVAVNFRESVVYLCEVTYSTSLTALIGRLRTWGSNWIPLCEALARDCQVPASLTVRPWVFIPQSHHSHFQKKLSSIAGIGVGSGTMPTPRVTYLESVVPWNYPSWDRKVTDLANAPSESLANGG